jgi:sulfite exporter TauE/SafE
VKIDPCGLVCTAISSFWAAWIAVRKGLQAMKTAQMVISGLLLIVTAVELEAQGNGIKGEEKQKAAIAKFQEILAPVLPNWIEPVANALLPMLINVIVGWASKTGFFGQLASG